MSVPPQPPGPYGQQPGLPQPGVPGGAPQPGQQPGYGQLYGQQPGGYYPQTGFQPQQQPGWSQQPGWGQQQYGTPPGGYGQPGQPGTFGPPAQPGPYGQPGQYPGQFGPTQGGKKSPLPWILAGGVLVVGIAVVLIVTITGGPNLSDPKSVAKAYVDGFNRRDASAVARVACATDKPMLDKVMKAPKGQPGTLGSLADLKFTLGDVQANGDSGTANVTMAPGNLPIPLKLVKEGGAWKVCLPSGSGSATASASTSPTGG
jgi:hypothetical protein